MKTLKVNAVITGIRSKVDKSLSVTFSTPELTTNERAEFMNYQGLNCDFTITPLDEKSEGVEIINKELETKSKSQRLRAVLFLNWKHENEPDTFENYYSSKMEYIIGRYKEKLD